MASDAIVVTTTVSDRADAERIAAALVARQLAACVQITGPVDSTYRWKGHTETAQEWMCLIKTVRNLYEDVERAIRELHSYEQPEIVALPVVAGSSGYLAWLADSVRSQSG